MFERILCSIQVVPSFLRITFYGSPSRNRSWAAEPPGLVGAGVSGQGQSGQAREEGKGRRERSGAPLRAAQLPDSTATACHGVDGAGLPSRCWIDQMLA